MRGKMPSAVLIIKMRIEDEYNTNRTATHGQRRICAHS